MIDDKSKLYSIKEKKQHTINYLLNLPNLIKKTYLNNPNCFSLSYDKFYINKSKLELINDFKLNIKEFIFDFNINYHYFGFFSNDDETTILSFYDSLNINKNNYELFISNKKQIFVLHYFDELSFDYNLRPNTLYCDQLKEHLLLKNYKIVYGKLLRLFYLDKDIIPIIKTFTGEEKDSILKEHLHFEYSAKNVKDFNLNIFLDNFCNSPDYKKINFNDTSFFFNFSKLFLFEKMDSNLKSKEKPYSTKRLKI